MIHARRFVLLFALLLSNLLIIWSPDVLPPSLFAWTVLREGDVDYDEFTFLDRESYFFRACGRSSATAPPRVPRSPGGPPPPGPTDHVCSIFPPGAGLLALPAFAPFVVAGQPPNDLGLLLAVGKVVAAAWEALAAVLLIAAASRVSGDRGWALVLGLLYLFATSVRTVSSQALWQHGAVHLLLAAALLVLVDERPAPRALFLAGLALGFAVVVRQTSAVFAIAGALALLWSRRPLVPFAAGAVLGALPLVVYDVVAFGDPFEQGYGEKPFETPLLLGLYGLLLSPSRGLLVYSPFLVFAVPTLARAWRERSTLAPLWRAFGLATLALLLGYAFYAEWWGGRVFGARFLSDAFPILTLALAVARPRGRAAVVFAATAAWALLLHTAAALVYDQRWDTTPTNVNFDPSRLFAWSDPQWLSVLGDAVSRPTLREGVAVALSAAILGVLLFLERRVAPAPH